MQLNNIDKSKYISEIDGLRAIAVLAVIVFHINPNFLPGGFIGVDIFFVISGYLITGIIYKEISNHAFSLCNFYSRRIKRILPVLYVVFFISIAISYALFLPQDIAYFNDSLKNSIFFWANQYFASFSNYFAPQSYELPLLHMWSLSVEEQFYFVWPLILLLILRFSKNFLLHLVGVVIIGSFFCGEMMLIKQKGSALAYYSLLTRSGELMLGGLLAILEIEKSFMLKKSKWSYTSSLLGGSLILLSLIFLKEHSKFPGINAFYPSFGAFLLIYSFLVGNSMLSPMLKTKPLIFVGKISYSLYLWHWIILAYMRYIYGAKILPLNWNIFALVWMIILSTLSWKWIEQPIRKSKISFPKSFGIIYVLPTILIMLIINASNTLGLTKDKTEKIYTTYGGEELCHGRISEKCLRGDLSKKPTILIIGDSHAAHLNYFFDELGKKHGWSALVLTASSCSPIFDYDEKVLPEWAQEDCRNLKRYFENNFQKFDQIILASHWAYHMGITKENFDLNYNKKLEKTIERLLKNGKKISIVAQVPMLTNNPNRIKKFLNLHLPVKVFYNEDYNHANTLVSQITKKFPDVKWIKIDEKIKEPLCDKHPFHMDNHHLSKHGALCLARIFQESNENVI
jgi:peptidoglycan/LPS O-acetylase OafA/YrhL